jgi:hypothetical protein
VFHAGYHLPQIAISVGTFASTCGNMVFDDEFDPRHRQLRKLLASDLTSSLGVGNLSNVTVEQGRAYMAKVARRCLAMLEGGDWRFP